MQDGMLYAADILIDRQPVIRRLALEGGIGAGRTEPGEIPGRLEKCVEGVRFPPCRLGAARLYGYQKPFERLLDIHITALLQGAGEKTGIKQMQDCMLYAADILIDRQPVIRHETYKDEAGRWLTMRHRRFT